MPGELDEEHPVWGPFFGIMGATAAIVFTSFGAAYGTAKSAIGISAIAPMHGDILIKHIVPVIMAGILGIYGLVVALLASTKMQPPADYPLYLSFLHLGAGLSVGLCGLASGYAIGITGDAGVRASALQPKMFVAMILILIFAEVVGIYGFIVALLLAMRPS